GMMVVMTWLRRGGEDEVVVENG
ncbi:hypothetical protein A2U01_0104632, partial [Trifolium medium]|nr:hypothetical protein [Trifolium medium]